MLDIEEIVNAHIDPGVQSTHWGTCHLAHKNCAILALAYEVSRLRDELDQAHDARIEAQNPGIDMDQVRKERAERRSK